MTAVGKSVVSRLQGNLCENWPQPLGLGGLLLIAICVRARRQADYRRYWAPARYSQRLLRKVRYNSTHTPTITASVTG